MRRALSIALPALAFALSLTETLAIVSQDAFFLRFNASSRIPLASVVGSIAATLAALLLTVLARRFSARSIATGAFATAALITFACALWTRHGTPTNTFVQYALLDVTQIVLPSAFWAFVQEPLDPATARRILPKVGFAGVVGGMVTGFLVPAWLRFGSTTGLLVGSAFACGVASLLIAFMRHGAAAGPAEARAHDTLGMPELFRQPLPRQLVIATALLVVVRLVMSFYFKSSLQQRFDDKGIASAEGLLEALSAVLSLPLTFWVSSRVLARAGVHWSFAVAPACMALGLGAFAAFPLLPVIAGVVLVQNVLKPTLAAPADGCLAIAVDPALRARFRLVLDGVVVPAALVVGGIALSALVGTRLMPAVLGAAVAFSVVMTIQAVLIKRPYVEAIRSLLERAAFDPLAFRDLRAPLPPLDAAALAPLLVALDTGTERGSALARDVLKEQDSPAIEAAMRLRVRDPRERTRLAALDWLDRHERRLTGAACPAPDEPRLGERERSLRLALALREGTTRARRLLEQWTTSPHPDERCTAARAARRVGILDVLAALARDPEPRVRRVAITCALRTGDPSFLGLAVDTLREEELAGTALESFAWQPAAIPSLERLLEDPDAHAVDHAIQALAKIAHPSAAALLWREASGDAHADEALASLAEMRARWPEGVQAPPDLVASTEAMIETGIARQEALAVLRADEGAHAFLRRELADQIRHSQERVARRLQLLCPATKLWSTFLALRVPGSPDRALALELLRVAVPRRSRERAVVFFEDRPTGNAFGDVPTAKAWIEEHGDDGLRMAAHYDRGLTYPEGDPMKGLHEPLIFLRDVDLFADVDNRGLVALSQVVQETYFDKGETLCLAGQPGSSLYVLREGMVRVSIQGREIGRSGPGECIGALSVLDGSPRSADVVALTPVRAYTFTTDAFRAVLDAHPPILWGIVRTLIRNLKTTNAAWLADRTASPSTPPPPPDVRPRAQGEGDG